MNDCDPVNHGYYYDPYWCYKIGPKGSTGPEGPAGPQGPQGPEGPPGPAIEFLTGIGAPDCSFGELGNAYIDLSSGDLFYKTLQPASPIVRSIPQITGTTHPVSFLLPAPYDTIQNAIDAPSTLDGDCLLLEDATYTITATLNINKSLTIQGNGPASTTIEKLVAAGGTTMINITASNVILRDSKIIQNYPSTASIETVIAINNTTATGFYIDNCEISPCEFGIGVNAGEFQITNCNFTYAPNASLNNSYRYIAIYHTAGVSIIDSNTFVADSGDGRCYFIAVTNVVGSFQGQLLVSNNAQDASPFTLRHLYDMEEFAGRDFQLFIIDNTTISEGNVPILLYGAVLNILRFIEVIGNSVQNTVGKGLIGIDLYYIGTTNIYSANNTLANPDFTAPWLSATVPSSNIVGYDSSAIPTNPSLPLAPCYWMPLM